MSPEESSEDTTATPPHGDPLVHAPVADSVAPITPRETATPFTRPSASAAPSDGGIGTSGERLTRQEAWGLVGRAVAALTSGERAVPASSVREKAFELLGRDSESLSERNFVRILKDAHDGDVIDLRRRGDDYEVAVAVQVAPVAEQLSRAAAAAAPPPRPAGTPPAARGMGHRGAGARGRGPIGRGQEPPPDLLLLGVVEEAAPAPVAPTTITATLSPGSASSADAAPPEVVVEETSAPRGRGRKKVAAKKTTTKTARAAATPAPAVEVVAPAAPRATKARRGRGKKKTAGAAAEG